MNQKNAYVCMFLILMALNVLYLIVSFSKDGNPLYLNLIIVWILLGFMVIVYHKKKE